MSFETFRFWDCSVSKCTAAAALDIGACERCMRHFCASHVSSPTHTCEKTPLDDDTWTAAQLQELRNLRQKVQDRALLQRSSSLNGGFSCELDASDPLGKSLMGGMHIHLRIRFSDGTTWLARMLRDNYTSFPDDFSNRIIQSECATLKWLEKLDLPAPKLHDYGLRNDPRNEVGVAYVLIDELPGTPLLFKEPSEEQLRKVYRQWVDILSALYAHPLEEIGSFAFQGDGEIGVGPIVGDRTGTFSQMGPFRNAREYYSTFAEKYLASISDGQLYSAYPVDAYLAFKWLKQLAEAGRWNAFESALDEGPFFLKHMDDKGDHILVDDEYNITGVIDWTFARVVPAFEAFGPSLLTADLNALFNGKPGLSPKDKIMAEVLQTKGLPFVRFAEGPDLVRRFSFALGMGMGMSLEEAKSLSKGIISTAVGVSLDLDWDVWRQNRISDCADDDRLRTLLLRQGEKVEHGKAVKDSPTGRVPRFETCSTPGCTRAAVRGLSCARCRRHLCAKHSSGQYHTCPSISELSDEEWEKSINDEVWGLLSHVNTHELVRLGTQLNNGMKCKFEPGKHIGAGATMGSANYHGWLVFENGERWIVRIPRTGFSDVPLDLVEYIITSEYATLRFLEATKVPAPIPFAYGLGSDPSNRVGVSYILMQALPGKPFYAHFASETQKHHVLEQFAEILVELSKHPLPRAGSFVVKSDQIDVGPVASNRFVALKTYGPFDTASDYLYSIIEQHLDLIADGQLYPGHVLEAFLFYRFLQQNKQTWMPEDTPGRFFLKHVDDKGDHLLVDEHFNITGIIDWQFARVVPAAEAFGQSYATADITSLYSSNAGITDDDRLLAAALRKKGANSLSSIAEGNEIMRRFHHGLANDLAKDQVREMLRGMVACVQGRKVEDLDAWITEQCKECRGDPRWKNVQDLLMDCNQSFES